MGAIEIMKKGANTDRSELKIGGYKLLTGAEKLLALDQNPSVQYTQTGQATCNNKTHRSCERLHVTREESLLLKTVSDVYVFSSISKDYQCRCELLSIKHPRLTPPPTSLNPPSSLTRR